MHNKALAPIGAFTTTRAGWTGRANLDKDVIRLNPEKHSTKTEAARRGGCSMKTRIRHIALNTENWDRMARFYQTIFRHEEDHHRDDRRQGNYNPNRGHISDGVIGFAMLQKHPGNQSGLDHFGFEVEEIPVVLERMRNDYPELLVAKSLPHVPFSVSRGTDPCGTQYDISQKGVAKVREGYLEDGWEQPRADQPYLHPLEAAGTGGGVLSQGL